MKNLLRAICLFSVLALLLCSCSISGGSKNSADVRIKWGLDESKNKLSFTVENKSSGDIDIDLASVLLEQGDKNDNFKTLAEKFSQLSGSCPVNKGKTHTTEISLAEVGIPPLDNDTVYRISLSYRDNSKTGGATASANGNKTTVMHTFTPKEMIDEQKGNGNEKKSEDVRITWSYDSEKNEATALIENKSSHDVEIPLTFVPWIDRVESDGTYTALIESADTVSTNQTVKSGESLTETASLDVFKVASLESGQTYRFSLTYRFKNDVTTVYHTFTVK